MVSRHTADSKPVKQEVNSTVILPPLVFPALANRLPGQSACVIIIQSMLMEQFYILSKGRRKIRPDQERRVGFYTLSLAETGTLYFYLLLKYQQIFDKELKRKEKKLMRKTNKSAMTWAQFIKLFLSVIYGFS
jgi:hypothetical protein